jgi:Zn-dependent protease
MLAAAALDNPLTWAILIGWILSVVIHEFAHGVVAHIGGDYTIRERGGLSLNPLQYVDPVMSIVLPAVVLMMGGIPLPGGVTYVRRDLLRSRTWDALVSAAGPASNFILFLLLSLPFHPTIGFLTPPPVASQAPNGYLFLAAMAQLQMVAVVLNLLPVPPLDGFQMVAAYMDPETRDRLMRPPFGIVAFIGLFLILSRVPHVMQYVFRLTDRIWLGLGFGYEELKFFTDGYNLVLLGKTFD